MTETVNILFGVSKLKHLGNWTLDSYPCDNVNLFVIFIYLSYLFVIIILFYYRTHF